MSTLISFLGKSQLDKSTGYRTATYQLAEGVQAKVPFLGMALARHLQPKRLVLLGTRGSMWDVFFESEAEARVLEYTDHWEALGHAVREDRVSQDMLDDYADHLGREMGMTVICRLIEPARDEAEQAALLTTLAELVPQGETVDLDVTHSFRHLPMLALVAARYLGRLRQVQVRQICYGALEMTDQATKITPVLRLDGMLRMLDGIEALACYDKDGDYGTFAPLLEREGLPASRANLLREAAFLERQHNTEAALARLRQVRPALQALKGPFMQLFGRQLLARLGWIDAKTRHERELRLADAYLARNDYLRATILMQEAFLSRQTRDEAGAATDFSRREEVRKEAQASSAEMRELFYLRNGMAHTVVPSNERVAETLCQERTLRERLTDLRRRIFG
ncbi:TIGR02221 family CRISPR-associated protein [Sphaerotilus uruguayifluvii]|uniref:CRISPR-associated Csx2 family protein n=1 Tax=Sphaerotilus uruguayifluvii TaxID=2735897 RepID=A0ABX2G6U9_9BURK|nr:TIGR02221 family CRISPR-associated protein [Leptothrix sp. C29]NRT58061.1 CRISPR-associated Csx2 family protein [Leptothrix sp. C29]